MPATPAVTAQPTPIPPPPGGGGTAVLVGAGDISTGGAAEKATAALLAKIPGTVFTAGDNAYNDGSKADYVHFNASWGAFKSRMRPAPGNHDYHLSPQYYYTYFGAAAGPSGLGYYVYTLGAWRIYSLNGETPPQPAQVAWLKNDLAGIPRPACSPTGTSRDSAPGSTGATPPTRRSGTRSTPQRPRSSSTAMTMTTSASRRRIPPGRPRPPGSASSSSAPAVRGFAVHPRHCEQRGPQRRHERRPEADPGPGRYGWQFIPVAGQSFTDSGQGTCH